MILQTRVRFAAALALLLAMPAAPAAADAPMRPGPVKICSANQLFCAQYDRAKNLTRIVPTKAAAGTQKRWSISGPLRAALISDTGTSVVTLPASANLLPQTSTGDTLVLGFYTPGKVPVTILLKQLVANPAVLPRTVSNIHWASSYGFEAGGMFVLTTSQNIVFRIDPSTGKPLNRHYY
jgi:hypothetical protein